MTHKLMEKDSRRRFVRRLGGAATLLAGGAASAAAVAGSKWPIALFEKPLQFLDYRELAEVLAEIGFDGIEATVRKGGHIAPERAPNELPGCVEALRAQGLTIPVVATSIGGADQPHAEALLRVAAGLGIKRYRLAGVGYDRRQPILKQLNELRPRWRELAALNRELGITGMYQNHAGSKNVGGQIWDLHHLLQDIAPDELGVAYDIRHAMVEGTSAWPISWRLIRPWIRAYYVKDFRFDGRRAKNVPMGEGIVGKTFYDELKRSGATLPVSLHVPHLPTVNRANLKESLAAIRTDFVVLRSLLS
jgi:sugar phosphate isomerase/epimerase